MKILHVTNAYPTQKHPIFGIFIKDQIIALSEEGVDYDLFFINAKENGKWQYVRALIRLRKKINKYDIVHCHHYITALVVALLNPKSKFIVSFLNDGINELIIKKTRINKRISLLLYKYIIKKTDARIFKNKVPDFLSNDKRSYLIPNGVDLKKFYPIDKKHAKTKLGLSTDIKYILFVSSQHLDRQQKRFDIFTDVIKILQNSNPNIEPLIMVDVPRDLTLFYYNSADLHLLTSDFEGSPNSVKESLACNTPVVSTNVGNVNNMLEGINGCYISESNDSVELAKHCIKSLQTNSNNDDFAYFLKKKKLDKASSIKKIIVAYSELMT